MQLSQYSLIPTQKGASREGGRTDAEHQIDPRRHAERSSDVDTEPAPNVEHEEEPEGYGFGV